MKQIKSVSLITLLLFLLINPASGYFHNWDFNEEKDQEYTKKSVYIFEGSLKVIERKYLNYQGEIVSDKETIKNSLYKGLDTTKGDSTIHSIHYLNHFNVDRVIKGDKKQLSKLRWIYINNSVVSCPQYPRGFASGVKYRFYITKEMLGIVSELKYLSIPTAAE